MEGGIRTPFDDLISSLRQSGRALSVSQLARECGVPNRTILEWAHILERERKAEIINRIDDTYISWMERTPSAPAEAKPIASPAKSPFSVEISLAQIREKEAKPETEAISLRQSGKQPKIEKKPEAKLEEIEAEAIRRAEEHKPEEQKKVTRRDIEETRIEIDGIDQQLSQVEAAIEKLERLKEAHEEAIDAQNAANERKKITPTVRPVEVSQRVEDSEIKQEEPVIARPVVVKSALDVLREKMDARSGKRKSRFSKIKTPDRTEVTEVSLKFSERMARQVRKIEKAAHEVEQLRAEKEQLLNDHYLPMQRRLESEIDTINDRIVKIENGIFGMQKRASDLPTKVAAVEKIQSSTINAHEQMRKAYDEAAALIEQSGINLSDEISRMEELAEQCRTEIAGHSAKSTELQKTLDRINQYEGDLAYQVSIARNSLSEQAQRLETAENYTNELATVRDEIKESVTGLRRELGSTKAMLTDIERQMEQMRKINEWANSIKDDYEVRMQEIDDYVKNGNAEFETLREAVEARFIRKYLRELRTLSDSYTFELNQAKQAEADLDSRVDAARKNLSDLLEEGQKIAYKYESAAKLPHEDAERFMEHAQTFEAIANNDRARTKVEQMIAQVVGRKTEHVPSAEPAPRAKKPDKILIKDAKPSRKAARAKKKQPAAGPKKEKAKPKAKKRKKR